MSNKNVTLIDLQQLKARGIIDDNEFQARKKLLFHKALRNKRVQRAKNGVVYILLAFFLGTIGIHNFYAGYWARGLIQLILSATSWLFAFIPLLITAVMALGEIWFINCDSEKKPFYGNRVLIWLLRFLSVAFLIYAWQIADLVEL